MLKTILWCVLIFVGLLALSVSMGWTILPFQKTSVANVEKQWAFAYQYDESLQAAARQVCRVEGAIRTATEPEEQVQRRSQLLAYEQNYTRIQAEYNQKLRNAFEAKYIRPSDVPASAPELETMKLKVCRAN